MKENLLYHIWSSGLLPSNLECTNGLSIQVIDTGLLNENAGPDFSNSKLKIDGVVWSGNVEMHVKSSEWFKHNHHLDEAYSNVILHVVFEDDKRGPKDIPTIELKNHFTQEQIISLSGSNEDLYCADQLPELDIQVSESWLDKLAHQRLEHKRIEVEQMLNRLNGDWESCLLILLSRSFGIKTNADSFERLVRSMIEKHSKNWRSTKSA